jgi:hypothetical protein
VKVLIKGDLLLSAKNRESIAEVISFDETHVTIFIEGKEYTVPRDYIGKRLHFFSYCRQCGAKVSSLFCEKCHSCGGYVCCSCGSCEAECAYYNYGFDKNGLHRNGMRFSDAGYDVDGYDRDGYNKEGYDRKGYNRSGYDLKGYDRDGYNKKGYNNMGYDRNGYDEWGYDRSGYNKMGYNLGGYNRSGYDYQGYDREGYNQAGYNRKGYDRNGYDEKGYDQDGYNKMGYNLGGYDRNGYDYKGYNREGYDRNGFNNQGLNSKGYTRNDWENHLQQLVEKRVSYLGENNCKRNGIITRSYSVGKRNLVDIQFGKKDVVKRIDFEFAITKRRLKFLDDFDLAVYDKDVFEKEEADRKNSQIPIQKDPNLKKQELLHRQVSYCPEDAEQKKTGTIISYYSVLGKERVEILFDDGCCETIDFGVAQESGIICLLPKNENESVSKKDQDGTRIEDEIRKTFEDLEEPQDDVGRKSFSGNYGEDDWDSEVYDADEENWDYDED